MSDASESKRIREGRKEAGLCVACGVAKPAKNRSSCRPCLNNRAAWNRADLAANPGKYAAKARERRAELKRLGICTQCTTAEAAEGRSKCLPCLEDTNKRVKKTKAAS